MRPQLISLTFMAIPFIIALTLAGGASGRASGKPQQENMDSLRSVTLAREDGGWIGHGICYGPHRDGQRPGGISPTAEQIREDLHLMASYWGWLLTYGSSEFARMMLEEIRNAGLDLRVMLGVWIEAEEKRDEDGAVAASLPVAVAANIRECQAAIALAAEYPDLIMSICVGNETQVFWSPNPCPLGLLIDKIRLIRAAVALPVTTADDYQYWLSAESRKLAREVDFITVHAHPLWNGKQLEEGLSWLREQLDAVQSVHPDRLVVIGETGWATSVSTVGQEAELIKGRPGEEEQAMFYSTVAAWASSERVPLLFFEAFDENWKGGEDPAEVEKHWGLFRADRSPKAAILGAIRR